jgi:hypothetical protein
MARWLEKIFVLGALLGCVAPWVTPRLFPEAGRPIGRYGMDCAFRADCMVKKAEISDSLVVAPP